MMAIFTCDYRFIFKGSSYRLVNGQKKAELVCNALNIALFRRDFHVGVIIHSDRGTQYCLDKLQKLINYYLAWVLNAAVMTMLLVQVSLEPKGRVSAS